LFRSANIVALLACALSLNVGSAAQTNDVEETYKSTLTPEVYKQTIDSAELYSGYLLGYCFEQVRGKALTEYSGDPRGWSNLQDTPATEGLKLFAPKVSPDTFSIVDLNSEKTSCWTQLDTVAGPLSMQPVLAEIWPFAEDGMLSMIDANSSDGIEQRTFLYQPDDDYSPVILHLRLNYSEGHNVIVGIVTDASEMKQKNGK